jgi:hypothetical protein
MLFLEVIGGNYRSQWWRGLMRAPAAARLLGFWVQILPWAQTFVSDECYVLPGRDLRVGLIVRRSPTECSVSSECDRETL